jgi:hypothetical protein
MDKIRAIFFGLAAIAFIYIKLTSEENWPKGLGIVFAIFSFELFSFGIPAILHRSWIVGNGSIRFYYFPVRWAPTNGWIALLSGGLCVMAAILLLIIAVKIWKSDGFRV